MEWLKRGLLLGAALLLVAQLLPYGRDRTNPPVLAEPPWDTLETRALAVRACYDCHSNQTMWPWYSSVAPMSWLVTRDVTEGRDELNFSEWDLDDHDDDAAETVRDGSMPPLRYTMLHPDARLTSAELDTLASGLAATLDRRP